MVANHELHAHIPRAGSIPGWLGHKPIPSPSSLHLALRVTNKMWIKFNSSTANEQIALCATAKTAREGLEVALRLVTRCWSKVGILEGFSNLWGSGIQPALLRIPSIPLNARLELHSDLRIFYFHFPLLSLLQIGVNRFSFLYLFSTLAVCYPPTRNIWVQNACSSALLGTSLPRGFL